MTTTPFRALLFVCGCLHLAALVVASADPSHEHIHEVRQGPVNIPPQQTVAPGPVSLPHNPPPVSTSSSSAMPPAPATPSPSSISASPSSSSSSPTPSTSSLSLNAIQNMTTCTSGLITWSYGGQEAVVELSVTNFGVSQDLVKRQNTADQMVDQVLVDTNATSGSWSWSSVNVPEGWYEIEAAMTDFATSSPPFFITNGSDVSCLAGIPPSSSTTSSSSSKSNVGAIIGGVIGGVLGLTLVALAIALWLRRRRSPSRGGPQSKGMGRWGSLTSNSSNIKAGGNTRNFTNQHYRTHSQSAGEMMPVVPGDKASATTTRGGSDEDATTMGEEKPITPSSPPGMNPFEALDTPAPYNRRASMYSLQTPSVLADSSRSVRASNHNLEQQAHRIRSSMESSLYLRTERLSMPILPALSLPRTPTSPARPGPRDEYPLSAVTASPVNRSSSVGASSGNRRTPRKPVPQYDPADLAQDPAQDTQSTFTATGESSHSHGTEPHGVPELSHKTSFGSHRPVHYLIPDMPLPPSE